MNNNWRTGGVIMRCINCLHYKVCSYHIDEESELTVAECNNFADEKSYIKLPCKYGDTVYVVLPGIAEVLIGEVHKMSINKKAGLVICIRYKKPAGWNTTGNFTISSIGKTIFLNEEEAEKALKNN